MATITIEFEESKIASAIIKAIGGVNVSDTAASSDEKSESKAVTSDEFLELCAKVKDETSAAELKEILGEFEFKTPKSAVKADDETMAEMVEALLEALDESEDEEAEDEEAEDEEAEDEEAEDEEITVDSVREAAQAFLEDEGKDALLEILEDFEVKADKKGLPTAKALKSLDEEELADLYADLTEED